ncbi:MAG: cbb3-type cytochrome c oxidase subunit I, partial [Fidelibacterota bacterium]
MNRLPEKNYLNDPRGWKSWLTTVDHKRIGVMYLGAILFFFLFGGLLALIMRAELFGPGADFLTAKIYNRIFTLHGAIMVFLFIIPAIPAALGNIILPLMIGAKDVAFPRLNLASWYIYLAGAFIAIISILSGG